jgi:hypothetical protein
MRTSPQIGSSVGTEGQRVPPQARLALARDGKVGKQHPDSRPPVEDIYGTPEG